MKLSIIFLLFLFNFSSADYITIKPSNVVNLIIIYMNQDLKSDLFMFLIPGVTECLDEASTNASLQMFFKTENFTDLLYFADPNNMTAAISLLNSAEEFYENLNKFSDQIYPNNTCGNLNEICNVTSQWLDSVFFETSPLTRFNFVIFSDSCVNNDSFSVTSDETMIPYFSGLQLAYNYLIVDVENKTCSGDHYSVIKYTNETDSLRCNSSAGLIYNLNNTVAAVNIFLHVSSENLETAIDFLINYVTETDYCALEGNPNQYSDEIQKIYYIGLYVNDSNTFFDTETVIPWVEYNSTDYFKTYVKESIEYVMTPEKSSSISIPSNMKMRISSIFTGDLNGDLQMNVMYTDAFPHWLPQTNMAKAGRPFDIIVVLEDEELDEDTVKNMKKSFYDTWQANFDPGTNSSGGLNLYVLNSTDEISSIGACRSSVEIVTFSSDHLNQNLWYLWIIIPMCLQIIGLCIVRFVVVSDMRKNKTEFQKMVSKLQLSPMEQAVFRDARDKLYLEPEFLIIDYEKILGKGSSSTVYEALLKGEAPLLRTTKTLETTKYHDCIVAAKISNQFGRDQVEGLICEVDAGKRLGFHSNICTLLGWTMHQGAPCLFFETMDMDLLSYAKSLKPPENDEISRITVDEENLIEKPFPKKIVLQILWQVANALDYISSMKIIHRDVAARNVLLKSGFIAKISDFGLSCDPDESTALYKASFNKKLPVKWLALEAIVDRIFSEKTDVWAFGVTIIEVFGYGNQPYGDIGAGELVDFLKSGRRLEKTDTMDDDIYNLAQSCWLEDSGERPTFEKIKKTLTELLEYNNESYGYLEFDETMTGYERIQKIENDEEEKMIDS